MVVDVIVDILASETDRIFEYYADDTVSAGDRVTVPFGGTTKDGVVMRVKEKPDFDAAKIKSVLGKLDEVPALTKECLQLAEALSKAYFVSKASALRLFLPAEMRKGTVREKFVKFAEYAAEDLDGALPNLGRMRASPSCFRHTCHFLALTVNLLSYVQVR